MKKTDTASARPAEQSFEKSLERLEMIVREMESGKLGLEEMIVRFEEGQSLIKVCSKTLNEVQKKIEVLVKKGDGLESEELEEMADSGGEEPGDGKLF